MNIVIEIGHPAHVHHFKNLIWALKNRGHTILICAFDKEVTLDLLNYYKFDYCIVGKNFGGNSFDKLVLLVTSEINMIRMARHFQPDLFVSRLSPPSAQVSKLFKKPHIAFADTEHAKLNDFLAVPFTDVICTPSCFLKDINDKHIRYDGYKELAYLHPNYFTPNPAVLTELGLIEGEPFIIVRFVSWQASHDVGHHGIRDKAGLVKALEPYGRILITSEGQLPPELEEYQLRISPEKLHDLLYYATLYIGEGGTTASEAAVLGTPSIYISSLVGTMGNFIELEKTYDLLFSFTDGDAALGKAVEILQDPQSKENWKIKRDRLLHEKIDVTAFMVWFIDSYPQSFAEMNKHQKIS